jgi:hypothetical protein
VPKEGISPGSEHRATYSRKLCCFDTGFPLVLNCAVDRCGDRVLCDEIAICQFYFLLDTTADGLSATPCSIDTIGRRRDNREGTRVWVAIHVRIERAGVHQSENGNWIDTRLHLPWRVEAPCDVTTSKRLLFYLFISIWTAFTTEVLGKGDGGIEWPGLGFLKLQGARSVGEGICAVIRVVRRH